MNDLRLILLGIGLFIIAVIYLWGTFKQKSQDRSHMRKITSFKRASNEDVKVLPTYDDEDEVSEETLAINTSDFSLKAKTPEINQQKIVLSKSIPEESVAKPVDPNTHEQKSQSVEEDKSKQQDPREQIITFLIKASPNHEFSGSHILAATEAVGLKLGDMKIFHHYGVEGMETEEAIFSLASMYEPGYFELEEMDAYKTKGLLLFMQLPSPIDNVAAFDLMQEIAMELARSLEGEICNSEHKPIDENTLRAMRDMAAGIV
jgi:cell division protein ZipA